MRNDNKEIVVAVSGGDAFRPRAEQVYQLGMKSALDSFEQRRKHGIIAQLLSRSLHRHSIIGTAAGNVIRRLPV